MYLVYGLTTDSEPLVWEVAVLETEKAAKEFAKLCYEAAQARYAEEQSKGFEYSDSICVQNVYDINAQYHQYNPPEKEGGPYTINIEYHYREILMVPDGSVKDWAFYRKLKSNQGLGKSYKWPEKDGEEPEGWDWDEQEDYDLRTHHTR